MTMEIYRIHDTTKKKGKTNDSITKFLQNKLQK